MAPQPVVMAEALMLREGSTGRVVTMLPQVWAVAETCTNGSANHGVDMPAEVRPGSRPKVEVAFYRKYTEGMMRRYSRFSSAVFVNAPVG